MTMTTKGEMPDELIRFVESVTFEDERIRMVRIDKYLGDEWVGNDLRGEIKTGFDIGAETAKLG